MTKTVILQTISLPRRRITGLTVINNKVWVSGTGRNKIYHGEIERGRYKATGDITSHVRNPTGLAWDGKKLYVADRKEKTIFTIEQDWQKMEQVLSLKEFKPDKIPLVFLIPSSEIADITWGKGLLWFTCKAGYSSSFYAVDVGKKKVVHRFNTRGPEPQGISFDSQEKYLWVLDSRNRELSQFTLDGKWTGRKLLTSIEVPVGLTIDKSNTFWTSDPKTGKLYQLKEKAD